MKKRIFFLLVVIILTGVLLNSCKEEEGPMDPATHVTVAAVSGTIRDSLNGTPVNGATVNLVILRKGISENRTTGSDGSFQFVVDLGDTLRTPASLTITKRGYKSKVTTVDLFPGQTRTLPDIAIERDTTTGVVGGTTYANTIAFISAVPTQLSVRGVGGSETSIITFEARDSFGVPIDFEHRDTIAFHLLGAPTEGGAYVSPPTAVTNASGRVAVTVNSGTVSGSLQIVARLRRETDGITIQSEPARIVIHGGLPSQRYFTIGASPINVPGLTINGKTSAIRVIVGDRYGNPVSPGTAIHFFTDIGIVTTNTGFTCVNGFASATLFSGNPRGVQGFGFVKAQTVGEGGTTVIDSVRMLFSGPPEIIRAIGTYPDTVQTGGCVTYLVRVSDINGNPLSPGTTIKPTINALTATNVAPTSIRMPDTQVRGPGGTEFLFTVCDVIETEPPQIGGVVVVYITVEWEGFTVSQYIHRFFVQ